MTVHAGLTKKKKKKLCTDNKQACQPKKDETPSNMRQQETAIKHNKKGEKRQLQKDNHLTIYSRIYN